MTKAGEPLLVLGIETSCDETAAAVVRRQPDGRGEILSNVVRSQVEDHRAYGGVVPEIAARAHLDILDGLIALALREAGTAISSIDAVAATAGPGLIGGLLVGLTTAKAISLVRALPLLAINHLEAHALTPGLTDGVAPPYLLLLVSGGHTQLVLVRAVGQHERLGTTLDDALGEAFDKTAKLLGLGYPGGPLVEREARTGDATRFGLPRPMLGRPDANFSFAGLKTAVRHAAQETSPLTRQDVADLCASFEAAVCDVVSDRVRRAMELARPRLEAPSPPRLVVAGGVAANTRLRATLASTAREAGFDLIVPPPSLCTDNAAMIAWAGAVRHAAGHADGSDAVARPRWPLDEIATPLLGGGRAGHKA